MRPLTSSRSHAPPFLHTFLLESHPRARLFAFVFRASPDYGICVFRSAFPFCRITFCKHSMNTSLNILKITYSQAPTSQMGQWTPSMMPDSTNPSSNCLTNEMLRFPFQLGVLIEVNLGYTKHLRPAPPPGHVPKPIQRSPEGHLPPSPV